jgi:glycosyltransferase involved in cell wall biosynthesis
VDRGALGANAGVHIGAVNPGGHVVSLGDLAPNCAVTGDYPAQPEKIAGRCIFCSVPDRGLQLIPNLWPTIKEAVPDASLVITSDYRLWGSQNPLNYEHRLRLVGQEGIVFLGAVPRPQLIALQSAAQVHLYPCTYDELFCISAAECQAAGAYPITSAMGALETTNEFGVTFTGHPEDLAWQKEYTAAVIELLSNQASLTTRAEDCMRRARARFSWDKICDKWEKLLNGPLSLVAGQLSLGHLQRTSDQGQMTKDK